MNPKHTKIATTDLMRRTERDILPAATTGIIVNASQTNAAQIDTPEHILQNFLTLWCREIMIETK